MVKYKILCYKHLIDRLEQIRESIDYLDVIIFNAYCFNGTNITELDDKKSELKKIVNEAIDIMERLV